MRRADARRFPREPPGSALTKKLAVGTMILPRFYLTRARVAELADALASGASDRKVVEVRVLSRAPKLLVSCRASLLRRAALSFYRKLSSCRSALIVPSGVSSCLK